MSLPSDPSRAGARAPSNADADAEAAREEFLFHLYRGSELLQDGRVHEAKEELESALRLQPLEPKGQDLLAVVYFRLGLYPRAIDIFAELVKTFPRERTPRINLALCYLKTGQCQRARDLLEETVVLHPEYERGWSYLGLAYEGLGDLWRAREAFLRAGQAGMARRMEERMGTAGESGGELETPTVERYYHAFGGFEPSSPTPAIGPPPPGPGPPPPPGLGPPPPGLGPPPPDASEAVKHQPPPRPLSSPPPAPSEYEGPPAPRAPSPPPPAIGGDPAAERFLRQRQGHWPRGAAPFVPHEPSGHLYVRVGDVFVCRPEALSALSPAPEVPWRFEPWGGEGAGWAPGEAGEGFARVRGRGHLALSAAAGRSLAGLSLHGGPFWVEWRSLVGFDAALALEQLRAPFDGGGAAGPWARIEGRGLVVLGLPARHLAFRVPPGESVVVRRGAICGWWGPLLAETSGLARGGGQAAHAFVAFSGEGFVLTAGGG
ncbi:MAG TPA: tetratricopeptide repeat protein [Polyangiaceae bacterium]|nr:tetratricopeptide repeat protein [Polyangiaceae bacterium]